MGDEEPKTKRLVITIIIALLALLTLVTVVALRVTGHNNPPQKVTVQPATTKSQNPNVVAYTGIEGQTVLAQLKTHAKSVEVKDSPYGPYVDSINGIKGGTDSKYWSFYVNDQLSSVGAGAYTTANGDKIEWRFE